MRTRTAGVEVIGHQVGDDLATLHPSLGAVGVLDLRTAQYPCAKFVCKPVLELGYRDLVHGLPVIPLLCCGFSIQWWVVAQSC